MALSIALNGTDEEFETAIKAEGVVPVWPANWARSDRWLKVDTKYRQCLYFLTQTVIHGTSDVAQERAWELMMRMKPAHVPDAKYARAMISWMCWTFPVTRHSAFLDSSLVTLTKQAFRTLPNFKNASFRIAPDRPNARYEIECLVCGRVEVLVQEAIKTKTRRPALRKELEKILHDPAYQELREKLSSRIDGYIRWLNLLDNVDVEIDTGRATLTAVRAFEKAYRAHGIEAARKFGEEGLKDLVRRYTKFLDKFRFLKIDAKFRRAFAHETEESLKPSVVLQESLQALAQERKEAEELARREEEARAAAEAVRREQYDAWQARIEQRCRQIVTVCNGVFGLEIEPSAVLNGEVQGFFASITSAQSSYGNCLSLHLDIRLEMQLHAIVDRTWLDLEEGDEEPEWKRALASANFLVWHELAHLVEPSVATGTIGDLSSCPEEVQAHAREVVIDAMAILLGESVYAHPGQYKDPVTTAMERKQIMLDSHNAMGRRLLAYFRGKELTPSQAEFIKRFYAELVFHGQRLRVRHATTTAREMWQAWPALSSDERGVERYRSIYERTFREVGVKSLRFRQYLSDGTEEACCSTNEQAETIH